MAKADNLGPLLRLSGLSTCQLPPVDAEMGEMAPLLLALLQEGVAFIDTVDDPTQASPWKARGVKRYGDKNADGSKEPKEIVVGLLERAVSAEALGAVAAQRTATLGGGDLAARAVETVLSPAAKKAEQQKAVPETWFCRRSLHRNAAAPGTAAWEEFYTHLKEHHAAAELDMTPTVMAAREALVWPAAREALQPSTEEGGRAWTDFTLALHEMRHAVGRPVLRDRVFPVLQMSCSVAPGGEALPEVLILSVTVHDYADYTADPRRLSALPDVVVGAYVSVERLRLLPRGAAADFGMGQDAAVEWVMATASDAAGVLPAWMQAMAVPGQIAKDVPLFLRWVQGQRSVTEGANGTNEPENGTNLAKAKVKAKTKTTETTETTETASQSASQSANSTSQPPPPTS